MISEVATDVTDVTGVNAVDAVVCGSSVGEPGLPLTSHGCRCEPRRRRSAERRPGRDQSPRELASFAARRADSANTGGSFPHCAVDVPALGRAGRLCSFRTSSTRQPSRPIAHVDHMRTTSIPSSYGTFTNHLHISRHLDSCARRPWSVQAGRSGVDADRLCVGRSRILHAVAPASLSATSRAAAARGPGPCRDAELETPRRDACKLPANERAEAAARQRLEASRRFARERPRKPPTLRSRCRSPIRKGQCVARTRYPETPARGRGGRRAGGLTARSSGHRASAATAVAAGRAWTGA